MTDPENDEGLGLLLACLIVFLLPLLVLAVWLR